MYECRVFCCCGPLCSVLRAKSSTLGNKAGRQSDAHNFTVCSCSLCRDDFGRQGKSSHRLHKINIFRYRKLEIKLLVWIPNSLPPTQAFSSRPSSSMQCCCHHLLHQINVNTSYKVIHWIAAIPCERWDVFIHLEMSFSLTCFLTN